jgi:acylphosphatase
MATETKACKIIVHGLVHGVFFRQSAKETADGLNLRGTVRNCSDGTVEILAEGDEKSLDKLEDWCLKGPDRARVTKMVRENIPATGFTGFQIIR